MRKALFPCWARRALGLSGRCGVGREQEQSSRRDEQERAHRLESRRPGKERAGQGKTEQDSPLPACSSTEPAVHTPARTGARPLHSSRAPSVTCRGGLAVRGGVGVLCESVLPRWPRRDSGQSGAARFLAQGP